MKQGFSTTSVHGGKKKEELNGSKTLPIYQTSVFTFKDLDESEAYYQHGDRYMYTRMGNPNQRALGEAVAQLEDGSDGVATSSGMSAIMAAILAYVGQGDHILCNEEIYGGTSTLLEHELSRFGIETTFVDLTDELSWPKAIKKETKLLITEVITNPLLKVIDIRRVVEIARSHGIKVVIDNTFTTPFLTKPLQIGADLVVHSATKYIGGHSDVTAGVVAGHQPDINRVREITVHYGSSLSPFEAWLGSRGLKTLALRMEKQCANALQAANFLDAHPKVKEVYYPGLIIHPHHLLATDWFGEKYGAVVSFTISNEEQINEVFRGFNLIKYAPTLAGVESIVSHPETTSHRYWDEDRRIKAGITKGLIRLSVGVEDVEDIIEDLDQALNR